MDYIPQKGDIIHLQFDPSAGYEMKGKHYALVVSPNRFNERGLVVVCPISQGNAEVHRTQGLIVSLAGCGTHTQGAVHCQHFKSLDWRIRNAQYKESVPSYLLDEVLARLAALLDLP